MRRFGDPVLEARADEMCELIRLAQRPDGYINTYYTLRKSDNCDQKLQEGNELRSRPRLPGSGGEGETLFGPGQPL